MANYYTKCISNFFAVTDVKVFKKICDRILVEGYERCYDFYKDDETSNKVRLAFNGPFSYRLNSNSDEFTEDSYDAFKDIQKLLEDGECIIFTEIGWEKLKCITAGSVIVTKDKIDYVNMDEISLTKAREMLNNPEYVAE